MRGHAPFAGGRDDLQAAAGDVAGGEDAGDVRPLEAVDGDALLVVEGDPGPLEQRPGRDLAEDEDGRDRRRSPARPAISTRTLSTLASPPDLLDLAVAPDGHPLAFEGPGLRRIGRPARPAGHPQDLAAHGLEGVDVLAAPPRRARPRRPSRPGRAGRRTWRSS